MNDYYSQLPQPPLETRIQNCISELPLDLTHGISNETVREVVSPIVRLAKEYSMTGYSMFGRMETRESAIEALRVYHASLCDHC